MRRKRTRGRSSGQTLVEFALILLPLVVTFFGAIEFSLIMASIGSFNFAAREGARIGSILGRTDPLVDTKWIIPAINAHVSGVVMATATEIDIYRAASDGSCLDAPDGSVDNPLCVKGVYSPSGQLLSGPWAVAARNDSLTSADYLGVRVKYNYNFLTGFVGVVGSSLALTASSAQRIEPQDFNGLHHAAPILALASQRGIDASAPATMPGGVPWQSASPWQPALIRKDFGA